MCGWFRARPHSFLSLVFRGAKQKPHGSFPRLHSLKTCKKTPNMRSRQNAFCSFYFLVPIPQCWSLIFSSEFYASYSSGLFPCLWIPQIRSTQGSFHSMRALAPQTRHFRTKTSLFRAPLTKTPPPRATTLPRSLQISPPLNPRITWFLPNMAFNLKIPLLLCLPPGSSSYRHTLNRWLLRVTTIRRHYVAKGTLAGFWAGCMHHVVGRAAASVGVFYKRSFFKF